MLEYFVQKSEVSKTLFKFNPTLPLLSSSLVNFTQAVSSMKSLAQGTFVEVKSFLSDQASRLSYEYW
jgi:hypothetical protein